MILTLLAALPLAGPATAACAGDTCSLGSRLRAHTGDDLPIPIPVAPAPDGDLHSGQPGLVVATPAATAMQQSPATGTPGASPRSVMLAPSALTSKRNVARSSIVTWCAELPDAIASFNPDCAGPDSFGIDSSSGSKPNPSRTHGFVRYAATRNQIGGQGQASVTGTAQMFFNGGGFAPDDLPCIWGTTVNTAVMPQVNPDCGVGLAAQEITETANDVHKAHLAAHGTILGDTTRPRQTVTAGRTARVPIPPAGQNTKARALLDPTERAALPMTRNAAAPSQQENLVRTGADPRTGGGQGNLEMVSGATSSRSIRGPNAERSGLILDLPEPDALTTFSAGFLVLVGCYVLARRRGR